MHHIYEESVLTDKKTDAVTNQIRRRQVPGKLRNETCIASQEL